MKRRLTFPAPACLSSFLDSIAPRALQCFVDHQTGLQGNNAIRPEEDMRIEMRTLTAYGIGVLVVLAIVNGAAWIVVGTSRSHNIGVFSAGFVLGMLGMYIAAYLYGYRRVQ
ncbi:MAG TPA: hypothetical protein VG848_01525 [Acetobacteraceae bacterium]|nr:hypothetical protein [Acetobacteraceae bacterium]